mmetsp:Transcript_11393/g.27030  ORF Transcript_11393/g.27030 Transcript_11393/m.27030 type:complete len:116 (-) Transcript_11393:777-1124(-)
MRCASEGFREGLKLKLPHRQDHALITKAHELAPDLEHSPPRGKLPRLAGTWFHAIQEGGPAKGESTMPPKEILHRSRRMVTSMPAASESRAASGTVHLREGGSSILKNMGKLTKK